MKPRILVVDDQPENIRLLLEILKDDYAVVAATSGLKAIDLAHKEPKPDLILIDFMMPEMNGVELCHRLKHSASTRLIPVVVVSALQDHEDREAFLIAGAAGFISKPFNAGEVLQKVEHYLEFDEAKPSKSDKLGKIAASNSKRGRSMSKPRLLIVDDQPENLQILLESLKEQYSITVATSGPKALEIAVKDPVPDLALLDIIMPDMNGFELCRRLKSDPKTESISVIFVTVMEAEEDIMMGFQIGGVDYVTKPYRIEELKARIAAHIKLQQQRAELETLISHLQESQALNLQQARINASGQLIQNIAHQWRQPLTHITLDIETMLDSHEHKEISHADLVARLGNLKNTLQGMSKMISDFSSLFKPTEQKDSFSVNDMVAQALTFFQANIEEDSIVLTQNLQEDCRIEGYPTEYTRVVIMILSNAVELLKERSVPSRKIDIVLTQDEDGLSHLRIWDNAGGIEEEMLEHLFEPYTSSKFAAFGVGLHLFASKMLIEKHMGGKIMAENIDGGAAFTLVV